MMNNAITAMITAEEAKKAVAVATFRDFERRARAEMRDESEAQFRLAAVLFEADSYYKEHKDTTGNGFSCRKLGDVLGLGKTTVNDAIRVGRFIKDGRGRFCARTCYKNVVFLCGKFKTVQAVDTWTESKGVAATISKRDLVDLYNGKTSARADGQKDAASTVSGQVVTIQDGTKQTAGEKVADLLCALDDVLSILSKYEIGEGDADGQKAARRLEMVKKAIKDQYAKDREVQ